MIFILLLALGIYVGAMGVTAVLIALVCAHWVARLAMLLAASVVFGCVPMVMAIRGETGLGMLLGALLLVGACSATSAWIRVPMALAGILLLIVAALQTPWRDVQGDWVVRSIAVVGLISTMMLSLRVAGFRLVALSPPGSTGDVMAGTGRDLDQWCAWLDSHPHPLHFRSQVVQALRQDGVDFSWADTVANAYARYRGIAAVAGDTASMRAYVVPALHGAPAWQGFSRRAATRFSIAQVMVWITVVAAVQGFMRLFIGGFPTPHDLVYGPPLIIVLGVNTFAAAVAALSMPRNRTASLCCGVVVLAGVLAVPGIFSARTFTGGVVSVAIVVTMIAAVGAYMGFWLLRHRSYRLLRVRLSWEPITENARDGGRSEEREAVASKV